MTDLARLREILLESNQYETGARLAHKFTGLEAGRLAAYLLAHGVTLGQTSPAVTASGGSISSADSAPSPAGIEAAARAMYDAIPHPNDVPMWCDGPRNETCAQYRAEATRLVRAYLRAADGRTT